MTMNASQVCDFLISTLKASCLNFYLQESPFAVNINVKKTFIKNHAGVEVNPDVDNFLCIKCNAAAKNMDVEGKDSTSEDDEKYSDLNNTIYKLRIKLEKAENELSERKVDKDELVKELREVKKTINEVNEKNVLEIQQYKDDLKKEKRELDKEVKKSKVLNENLLLAEAQLANLAVEEKVIYNVETNNNFDILEEKHEIVKPEIIPKDVTRRKEMETKTKVDNSNYKECLKNFLENFKEHPDDELKYKQAALKMLEKGHNIFHVSLLDIGLYDINLKAFLSSFSRENLHLIEKDRKDIVMKFGESFGHGSFKSDTSVFINPKNYGQTWPIKGN